MCSCGRALAGDNGPADAAPGVRLNLTRGRPKPSTFWGVPIVFRLPAGETFREVTGVFLSLG